MASRRCTACTYAGPSGQAAGVRGRALNVKYQGRAHLAAHKRKPQRRSAGAPAACRLHADQPRSCTQKPRCHPASAHPVQPLKCEPHRASRCPAACCWSEHLLGKRLHGGSAMFACPLCMGFIFQAKLTKKLVRLAFGSSVGSIGCQYLVCAH